ncbi:excinuclease ABC subunit UvrB [Clostridium perfringens]|uniref:UvrABC system protein B n=1 Tax=Clostridium perfringens (strain ATCC 13124 / DSM 756 / JCM 1290 / NCIMB 6125 / NCTC 8237 / Type A) TaxID=195103 RepID=UVRB_CLOP1|nr:excinuclease ABC subunit UvrB [Clostridium perfringens]Q0TUD0.1 RecName: Full=UvrABC system protein B; Short=Protein UvrB; AltName: Full=Excinuclease ABC subunit B [Clostridium perfringens ATCC 13124]ABG82689.1 excinuclease ABC, B subunit [Clostridium perfringens ATCC 13124]EDT27956.1 excinuclease ABC, B subunit [Clostridium perfringens CPE str. F4969]EGT0681245.1 excinuclease ABC subunit UvrB [Clostridium perfringens]EGT0683229.1 excinuclease ABC subunit UvrB [Clostridium perfringens]EGT0
MGEFKIQSKFKPTGDQPKAIDTLVQSIENGNRGQTLLGVTGSGKTFTMANIIERTQKPTLILAHNKTLAAQLCAEFKEFFPDNIVEYFVSYYDYYQPEAYVPQTDTFIEKDASINDEIDKLRHSATSALLERRDVIIVASVSCIYGLGNPEEYKKLTISLRPGMIKDRDEVIKKLIEIQYERNDIDFARGTFRVRGDNLDIIPSSSSSKGIRIEFFGDEIDRIREFDVLTGNIIGERQHVSITPASHFAASEETLEKSIRVIEDELEDRLKVLTAEDKILEAQRLKQRTNYDIEMIREMGYCQGIENYSRILDGRMPGTPPQTLLDYFPEDFLMFIDESHVTLPQVRAMYAGDRSRKTSLVEFGFRLPCAFDNRPLKFSEFESKINQVVFVSATPGEYELDHSKVVAEQIIRPTGLLDPVIEIRPIQGQIDDLYGEIQRTVQRGFRVLITTLTKRMAEDLTKYLKDLNVKATYMHSDIDTLERMKIIRELRLGEVDVLIGINLLREGLDIPEVALVAILDADKEGFLRSETSLIQTIGRAARNSESKVIMYADNITKSMDKSIKETERRRVIQMEYNEEHNITPTTVIKGVRDIIEATKVSEEKENYEDEVKKAAKKDIPVEKLIEQYEEEMKEAAKNLQFERAAELRDIIKDLKENSK